MNQSTLRIVLIVPDTTPRRVWVTSDAKLSWDPGKVYRCQVVNDVVSFPGQYFTDSHIQAFQIVDIVDSSGNFISHGDNSQRGSFGVVGTGATSNPKLSISQPVLYMDLGERK